MKWLLEQGTFESLQAAMQARALPTAEEQAAYDARVAARDGGGLNIVGSVAQIPVVGVLTKNPDLWIELFGGRNTTYSSIVRQLAMAQADPGVSAIDLLIDSPGGQFAGLFDVMDAMAITSKPITARVESMAASAAYAIASQADRIVAKNRATQVGSIGVVASFWVSSSIVDITSTEAPKKRPDVRTDEGKEMVREHLDELHQIFVDAIAEGRKITVQAVNSTFGRGATLLAERAMSLGMIDAIEGVEAKPREDVQTNTEAAMDLNTLKSAHPDLYAQVRAEGYDAGVQAERDRVTAHLLMGEKSGAMPTAVEAIRKGDGMTLTLQAEYMTAGMNRADLGRKAADDKVTGAAADGAAPKTEDSIVDATLAILEAQAGEV